MNKENTFATNRDKLVLQPNNLTKRVRKKKEPEKDPPHEMSEYELYVQEKRRRNEEFMKRLELDKLKSKISTDNNSATSVNTGKTQHTTLISKQVMEHTGEGNHILQSSKATIEATNSGSSDKEATKNYKDEENWTIEFFLKHTKKKFMIGTKRKKNTYDGYLLLARWKDFSPADDTEEPLHHAAQHHKAQVISYVERPENVELLHHIRENKMNLFSIEIVQLCSAIMIR